MLSVYKDQEHLFPRDESIHISLSESPEAESRYSEIWFNIYRIDFVVNVVNTRVHSRSIC